MDADRLTDAYGQLFPRRLQLAHLALVALAEEASPDGWATPDMVVQFSRLYRVPRARLGGLVGLLCRRHPGTRRDVWTDAIREPATATPHLIRQHDRAVQTAWAGVCSPVTCGCRVLLCTDPENGSLRGGARPHGGTH